MRDLGYYYLVAKGLKICLGLVVIAGVVGGITFYWLSWYRFSRKGYFFSKSWREINGRTVVYRDRVGAKFNGEGTFVAVGSSNQLVRIIAPFDHWESGEDENTIYLVVNEKTINQPIKIRVNITRDSLGTDYRVDNLSQLPAQEPEKLGLIADYGRDKFIREIRKGDTVVAVIRWDGQRPAKDINDNYQATQIIVRRFSGKQDL